MTRSSDKRGSLQLAHTEEQEAQKGDARGSQKEGCAEAVAVHVVNAKNKTQVLRNTVITWDTAHDCHC